MKRIIVSVTNDLVTDQRVAKICQTLHENGYDLLLIGRKNYSTIEVQRNYDTKRLKLLFNRGFLFYAEYNVRLFFLLLFSKKDILYSNDVDTLIPNYIISKLQRKKLIFDSHELFSEVPELENKKFVKNFWLKIEKWIIPKLDRVITVSDSIKNYYKNQYGINAIVIRNVPITKDITTDDFDFSTGSKKIIFYQGSVNIGRGLELMIDTMYLLKDAILIIAGTGDIIERLEQKVLRLELENKVKFLGRIEPTELRKITPNADVGISLEEDIGLNYRYSLPNKIFDYIHSEVPILISDLPEMRKIVEKYNVGEILSDRTPKELAKLIESIHKSNYKNHLISAKKELNWEKEKLLLVKTVKNIG